MHFSRGETLCAIIFNFWQYCRNYCLVCNEFIYDCCKIKKSPASAGNRTRAECLEGIHANHYTTDASCTLRKQVNLLMVSLLIAY